MSKEEGRFSHEICLFLLKESGAHGTTYVPRVQKGGLTESVRNVGGEFGIAQQAVKKVCAHKVGGMWPAMPCSAITVLLSLIRTRRVS